MRSGFTGMIVGLLLVFLACNPPNARAADARQNCDLKVPPKDALVGNDGSTFLFTYPRDIGPAYTGCQKTWNEMGAPIFVLTFDAGSLVELRGYEINGQQVMMCEYKDHKLLGSSKGPCGPYDDIVKGIAIRAAVGDVPEPVPFGHDPRQ